MPNLTFYVPNNNMVIVRQTKETLKYGESLSALIIDLLAKRLQRIYLEKEGKA